MNDRCEECGAELVFASPDNHFQAEQYECPLCKANDEIKRLRALHVSARESIIKQVVDVLIEQGQLMGSEPKKTCKPIHGNCCTCQECGMAHDDCVCEHNELLRAILDLTKNAPRSAK